MAQHLSFERAHEANRSVAACLEAIGWTTEIEAEWNGRRMDIVAHEGSQIYVIEVKTLSEGRSDRVIPVLAQAALQAQAHAAQKPGARPLAMVYVEQASPSLLKQVAHFAEQYVANAGVGIVSANGLSLWRQALNGPVESIDSSQWRNHLHAVHRNTSAEVVNLFSDVNQWLLKLLLSPDIPEGMLNAPRSHYSTGAELAAAAGVSSMSVSRFLKQLRSDSFVYESGNHIILVRREELFKRWRAASLRTCPEMPMRLPIRAGAQQQISRFVAHQDGQACIGLFAAADGLGIGHVSGVPPYVCVPRLPRPGDPAKGLESMLAFPEGSPDFIIRQTSAPRSTLQGAVHRDGTTYADVIQIWLDVANHPSRGEEQADHIYRKVLQKVIDA